MDEIKPILSAENLVHTYGVGTPFEKTAVDGVSVDIFPNDYIGVIGHTGSGKSTFIQHLNGLINPPAVRSVFRARTSGRRDMI